jgi:hypothetical protein
MPDANQITQEENLVLGLFGGLKWVTTPGLQLTYDPAMVGKGMIGMNPQQPKKSAPYLEDLKMLSKFAGNTPSHPAGPYTDGAGVANDSRIPEIVDNFPFPLPILYLRARVGAGGIIGDDTKNPPDVAQYVMSDIIPYTIGTTDSIGEGKSISMQDYKNEPKPPTQGVFPHGLQSIDKTKTMDKSDTVNYRYPYDAWAYFSSPTDPNPNVANRQTPRKKDSFILISAGLDRVYGTADDITNFGSVIPD